MKFNFHKKILFSLAGILLALGLVPALAFAQNGGLLNNGGLYNNGGWLNNAGGLYTGDIMHGNGTLNNGQGLYNVSDNRNVTYTSSGGLLNGTNTNSSFTCNTTLTTFADVIYYVACIMNQYLIGILVTLATIYVIWGIVQYVLSPDSVEERAKSRQVIIWGILSMFIIISVWGIIQFFRTTIGI
jgi:hypothetical protein